MFHVYFDGEPELIGHVCARHRRDIHCADEEPDGNCAHVQLRKCDCIWAADCTACLGEREGVGV